MDVREARKVIKMCRWDQGRTPALEDQRDQAQRVVAADRRRKQIRANTRDRIELITTELEAGDWRTLGHVSPVHWYAELTDFILAPASVRRRLAEALRAEGYSLRSIATELDVSSSTVARDLGQVSRDETPERITGADGKTYPAVQKPVAVTEPAEPACESVTIHPEIKTSPLHYARVTAALIREIDGEHYGPDDLTAEQLRVLTSLRDALAEFSYVFDAEERASIEREETL